MKKIRLIILCLTIAAVYSSCKKDNEIGAPIEIIEDYVLPQEGASKAANDKIQELHDKYGSYFLYVYTQKDAIWTQAYTGGTSIPNAYITKEGDPKLVEPMLEFLNKAWLSYFSDDFLKKGGIPYRVFLCDTYYMERVYPDGSVQRVPYDYVTHDRSLTIAGMNEAFLNKSNADKTAWKTKFISFIWNYYVGQGLLEMPNGFYDIGDYITLPEWPLVYSSRNDPDAREAFLKRGFLFSDPSNTYVWLNSNYWWGIAKKNDFDYYMIWLLQASDDQIEPYLTNPDYSLIAKKWNYLIDFYKKNYNLDVRKIANSTF